MLRAFPELTFSGIWIPAIPAGITGFHLSSKDGRRFICSLTIRVPS